MTKIVKPNEDNAVTEGEVLTLIDEAHEDEEETELIEKLDDNRLEKAVITVKEPSEEEEESAEKGKSPKAEKSEATQA